MVNENKIDEAKKLIEEQNKKDTEECQKEIEEVLKKYSCDLTLNVDITINGQRPQIILLKK